MKPHLTLIADQQLGHVLTCVQSLGSADFLKPEQIASTPGLLVRFDAGGIASGRTFAKSDMLELMIPATELSALEVVVDDPSDLMLAPRDHGVVKGNPTPFAGEVFATALTDTELRFVVTGVEKVDTARVYWRRISDSATTFLGSFVPLRLEDPPGTTTQRRYAIPLPTSPGSGATYALMLLASGCKVCLVKADVVRPQR